MLRRIITCLVLFFTLPVSITAQDEIKHPDTEPWSSKVPYSQLNSSNYNPQRDPNIDMYLASWKESMPVHTHGGLVERYIFTRCDCDPMNPSSKGVVLNGVNRFSHATLRTHTSTSPTTLEGEQEVFYILSGHGIVSGGGETYEIFPGITFLIPANLEFTMTNTGDEPIMMYLVVERVPEGFRPKNHIVIHNEAIIHVTKTNDHWNNITKQLIKPEEGLAVIEEILTILLPARAMSQPFSYIEGVEAVYCTIGGNPLFLSGKQIRNLPPGSAYMVIPNGTTPHANINLTNNMVKYFYFGLLDEK